MNIRSFTKFLYLHSYSSIYSSSWSATRFHGNRASTTACEQHDITLPLNEVSLFENDIVWLAHIWFTNIVSNWGTSYLVRATSLEVPYVLLKTPLMSIKVPMANLLALPWHFRKDTTILNVILIGVLIFAKWLPWYWSVSYISINGPLNCLQNEDT